MRRSISIDNELSNDIDKIAAEQNKAINAIVEDALKMYRDYQYMENKAFLINQDILNVTKGMLNMAERTINNKASAVLSELAIQSAVSNMILAKSLDISDKEYNKYRLIALDFLKDKNRVLRLDEVL
ncbi:MAG: hypothetical protein RR508_07920 [Oscillospiraceae bacterium]